MFSENSFILFRFGIIDVIIALYIMKNTIISFLFTIPITNSQLVEFRDEVAIILDTFIDFIVISIDTPLLIILLHRAIQFAIILIK